MTKKWQLQRREVLRGMGAAILLPGLEAMIPLNAQAATTNPKRLILVYRPMGNYQKNASELPTDAYAKIQTADVKPLLNIISRVHNQVGYDTENLNVSGTEIGQGEHGAGVAALFSGKVPGYNASNIVNSKTWNMNPTFDQVIGSALSLNSICSNVSPGKSIHGRWLDRYCNTMSWKGSDSSLNPYSNPKDVFNLLFTDMVNPNQTEQLRLSRRKSILDFVLGDIGRYNSILGVNDKQKLDQYLTSLREVEKRIVASQAATPGLCSTTGVNAPNMTTLNPSEYPTRLGIMQDLCVKAFECNKVQIFNMMLSVDGDSEGLDFSNFVPGITSAGGWHECSHYGTNTTLTNNYKSAVAWQYDKFREFALKLEAVKEADGTSLLYNSAMVFTSGISDGNTHSFENLNCVVAGNLGGKLKTGLHLTNNVGKSAQPPIANIWLTLMQAFGLTQTSFGNSTGVISQILA